MPNMQNIYYTFKYIQSFHHFDVTSTSQSERGVNKYAMKYANKYVNNIIYTYIRYITNILINDNLKVLNIYECKVRRVQILWSSLHRWIIHLIFSIYMKYKYIQQQESYFLQSLKLLKFAHPCLQQRSRVVYLEDLCILITFLISFFIEGSSHTHCEVTNQKIIF